MIQQFFVPLIAGAVLLGGRPDHAGLAPPTNPPGGVRAASFAVAGTPAAGVADRSPAARLVVLLTVDQLRGDYLETFRPYFGEGGFRRFLEEGAVFTQASFEHGATETCVGHAVIATGAQPAVHGIVANYWWDQELGRPQNCAYDPAAPLVGAEGEGRSPRNLAAPALGDALRLSNGGRSRVIAVAGKDRSAIMLGGRLANAAYWPAGARFVTSRYYSDTLPEWVRRFNDSGVFERYVGRVWERLLPEAAYAVQGRDDQVGETGGGEVSRTFPHPLGTGEEGPGRAYLRALERSPFHDEIVVDFALEAVRHERLGRGAAPDILAISLSALDMIGHTYGPNSHEVMDALLRLDRHLARFFKALDEEVGLEGVAIALTADHGVAPLPEVVRGIHPGSGALRLSTDTVIAAVEAALDSAYGAESDAGWVAGVIEPNLFLDEARLRARGIEVAEAERVARDAARRVTGVHEAQTRTDLLRLRDAGARSPLALSIHPERSGHVIVVPRPYTQVTSYAEGTGHGSPWVYDRHVPIAFFGAGIRPGLHHGPAAVVDIAPTLAVLLGIQRPAAASGRVLEEALDERAVVARVTAERMSSYE